MAIAVFLFLVGVVLMVLRYRSGEGHAYFTRRGFERVADEVANAALGPAGPGNM